MTAFEDEINNKSINNKTLRKLLELNKPLVFDVNRTLLKHLSLMGVIILAAMFVMSLFVKMWNVMSIAYGVSTVVCLGFFLFFTLATTKYPKTLMPSIYVFFVFFFAIAAYHSIFSNLHHGSSITFIALLVIVPIILLDKTSYIAILAGLTWVTFSVACALSLPHIAAIDDITNSFIFGILGLYLGRRLSRIRLTSIENQRLLALERDIDQLTQLPNRRKLFSTLDKLEAKADFEKQFGIMMIDVDGFKKYNDSMGHQKGDHCLQELGQYFLTFSKQHNIPIFRFGGEEFLLLRQNASVETFEELASGLVCEVAQLNIPDESSTFGFVTISVGAATVHGSNAKTFEELILYADKAMYAAKRKGGNAYSIYHRKSAL